MNILYTTEAVVDGGRAGHALPTALAAHPARRGSPAGAARSKAQRGPARPGQAAQERGGGSLKGCPGRRPR